MTPIASVYRISQRNFVQKCSFDYLKTSTCLPLCFRDILYQLPGVSTRGLPEVGRERRETSKCFPYVFLLFVDLERQYPPNCQVLRRSELFDNIWEEPSGGFLGLCCMSLVEIRRHQTPPSPKYHGLGCNSISYMPISLFFPSGSRSDGVYNDESMWRVGENWVRKIAHPVPEQFEGR